MTATDGAPRPAADVIAAFEHALLDCGKVRLTQRDLWTLWDRADSAWAGTWTARARLAETLNQLDEVGVITQPARSGRLWDHALPPLPAHIDIPANRPSDNGRRLDPASEPWTPAMGWAGSWIRTANPPQRLRLAAAQINQWLLGTIGRPTTWAAREERSLQIFDDEKRLARLGALFHPSRLRPEDLYFDIPAGEIRIARLAEEGPVLVVENRSTFDSAWRALRPMAAPPYAAVIFGAGDSASTLIRDLLMLEQLVGIHPTMTDYAGDVDIAGIEAAAAFVNAADVAGLPARMAGALWHAVARSRPTGDDLTADPSRRPQAIELASRLGLPDSVHQRIRAGVRVPQERIDRAAFADTAWWAPTT